jgi:hypothetical protein
LTPPAASFSTSSPLFVFANGLLPDIDPAGGEFLHQFSVIRVRRYTQLPLSYGRLDKGIAFLSSFQLPIPSYSTGIRLNMGAISAFLNSDSKYSRRACPVLWIRIRSDPKLLAGSGKKIISDLDPGISRS